MKEIQFCKESYQFPSERLGQLRDSNDLLGNTKAIKDRIEEDGYLWFKGLIDRKAVIAARLKMLQFIAEKGKLAPNTDVMEGVFGGNGGAPTMGNPEITHCEEFKRVFEGPELFTFFENFFGEPATTFDYKWLRAVGPEQFTGIHCDKVYMGMGSQDLHTTWVPFGDITPEDGTLALAVGSHRAESFKSLRDGYGETDTDRDKSQGWYSKSPQELEEKFDAHWHTSEFKMGDVVIFGMNLLHSSTTNTTNRFRLSADIRFQPAGHKIDERWVGNEPKAHGFVPSNAGTPKTKEELAEIFAS